MVYLYKNSHHTVVMKQLPTNITICWSPSLAIPSVNITSHLEYILARLSNKQKQPNNFLREI